MRKRYLDIARTIQREIEQGVFKPGESVPGRLALSQRFDVTRATIDRAMRVLMQRGALVSRQGSGTYVADTPPRFRIACVNGHPDDALYASTLGCALKILPVARAMEQGVLNTFDGVIWSLPDADTMAFIRKQSGDMPQIVVNREMEDLDYVSTDHHGAICDLTSERLDAHPEAVPVFLSVPDINRNIPCLQRRQGFIDACRKRNRFYEELHLPLEFEAKLDHLDRLRLQHPKRAFLMVSATLFHTGAVAVWRRMTGLEWRKTLWYSDFDNDYAEAFWGVRVTSFLQDIPGLTHLAIEKMLDLLYGRVTSVRLIVPPKRREGET